MTNVSAGTFFSPQLSDANLLSAASQNIKTNCYKFCMAKLALEAAVVAG